MRGDSFGSFLANAGKITLVTADNIKVTVNKNFVHKLAIKIFGVPHIGFRIRTKYILNMLDLKKCGKVLDVGCGIGLLALYLATKGFEMYGVDLNKEKIDAAKRINQKLDLKVNFKCASILDLPFEGDKFDNVICSEVLEHVEDDQKAIHELSKVLKKEGLLIVTVPSKDTICERYRDSFGHVRTGYSVNEIERLVMPTDMEIVKVINAMTFFGKVAWKINRGFFFSKVLVSISFIPLYYLTLFDNLLNIKKIPVSYIVILQKK